MLDKNFKYNIKTFDSFPYNNTNTISSVINKIFVAHNRLSEWADTVRLIGNSIVLVSVLVPVGVVVAPVAVVVICIGISVIDLHLIWFAKPGSGMPRRCKLLTESGWWLIRDRDDNTPGDFNEVVIILPVTSNVVSILFKIKSKNKKTCLLKIHKKYKYDNDS